MSTSPADVVRSIYAAFGRQDIPAILAAIAPDAEWRVSGPPSVPFVGAYRGPAGAQEFLGRLALALDLTSFEPKQFLADGDTVVVLGRDRGHASLTRRPYDAEWVHVWRIAGGRAASFHEFLASSAGDAF